MPLAVAAPGRVKVEDHKFVGGVFEEGADGRGVDVVHFRGCCGDEGGGEERPHRQCWMAARESCLSRDLGLPRLAARSSPRPAVRRRSASSLQGIEARGGSAPKTG